MSEFNFKQIYLNELEKSNAQIDILDLDANNGEIQSWIYITKLNKSLQPNCIKIGYTTIENINIKLAKLNTCVPEPFAISFRIDIGKQTRANRYKLEHEFFQLLQKYRHNKTELFMCTDQFAKSKFTAFNQAHNNKFKII